MKKFSERINADWHTEERLEELLNEFFEDDSEPKTLTHLYCWLNTDWATMARRSMINDKYKSLINAAELECEKWVVNHGFENDKSFAKFTLQTQHNRTPKEAVEHTGEVATVTKVEIIEDTN